MLLWKVKAVAIQLSPTTNCPTPNAQPMSRLRHRVFSRSSSSHKAANATSISGHQPTGANAKAETAPAMKA